MRLGWPGALCFFCLVKLARISFGQYTDDYATNYYDDYQLYSAGQRKGQGCVCCSSDCRSSPGTRCQASGALMSCFVGPGLPFYLDLAVGWCGLGP